MEVHIESESAVSSLHRGDGAGVGVGDANDRDALSVIEHLALEPEPAS